MAHTIIELTKKVISIDCGSTHDPFIIKGAYIHGNIFGEQHFHLLNQYEVLAYIANPMLLNDELGKKLPLHCCANDGGEFKLNIPYTQTGVQIKEPEAIPNPFKD